MKKQLSVTGGASKSNFLSVCVFLLGLLLVVGHVSGIGADSAPGTNLVVWISPGTFTMGSPTSDTSSSSNERPETQVTITRGFWMSQFEVTQGEYLSLMNTNPSRFHGNPARPVETVSWQNAVDCCARLTSQERLAGRVPAGFEYRLPTEAEWEYACRGGSTTRFSFGDDESLLGQYAWYAGNSGYNPQLGIDAGGSTAAVGTLLPNAWGLHDMHGNVTEWCLDWRTNYPGGRLTDPSGPGSGTLKVSRGGALNNAFSGCRSAYRTAGGPLGSKGYGTGFRVVLARGLDLRFNAVQVGAIADNSATIQMTFVIPPGSQAVLETSTDLAVWASLSTIDGSNAQRLSLPIAGELKRFYRLRGL